jgi:hypothetical protein
MGYATTQIAIYGIEIKGFIDDDQDQSADAEPNNKLQVLRNLIYDEEGNDLVKFPFYVDEFFEIPHHKDLSSFDSRMRHFLNGRESSKTSADILGMDEKDFVQMVEYIQKNKIELRPYRYKIELMGDGADSRITDEDAGVDTYAFGILLASKGYAYNDKINDYTNPVNPIAIQRWNDYCVPLLTKAGIEIVEPEVVRIVQVW